MTNLTAAQKRAASWALDLALDRLSQNIRYVLGEVLHFSGCSLLDTLPQEGNLDDLVDAVREAHRLGVVRLALEVA